MFEGLNEAVRPEFEVWKTIRLGVYRDTDAYRKALKKKGINISPWADATLSKIDIAAGEVEVDLVKIFSAQLGFTRAARRDAIFRRAFSIGLEHCMPEIGPRLREEYTDQPVGEWIIVGMDPVPVSVGYPEVFVIERDDGELLWLNSFWVFSGHLWSPESRWVFTLPRK